MDVNEKVYLVEFSHVPHRGLSPQRHVDVWDLRVASSTPKWTLRSAESVTAKAERHRNLQVLLMPSRGTDCKLLNEPKLPQHAKSQPSASRTDFKRSQQSRFKSWSKLFIYFHAEHKVPLQEPCRGFSRFLDQ